MVEADAGPEFTFRPTAIQGVLEVDLAPLRDERGAFSRVFHDAAFRATGLFPDGAVQTNLAVTEESGTVRGLHWQEVVPGRIGEAKLVLCVSGRVFDVAVDLRLGSPTRLRHHALELAAGSWRALLIPPGVAHGMQALEDRSTLLYHHAAPFDAALERGARPDDPGLAILWPLEIRNLSARDRSHPPVDIADGRGA